MSTEFERELEQLSEKMTSSETVYDGVLLHVVRDEVELPNVSWRWPASTLLQARAERFLRQIGGQAPRRLRSLLCRSS